jgi:uncharacterized Zn finger protein
MSNGPKWNVWSYYTSMECEHCGDGFAVELIRVGKDDWIKYRIQCLACGHVEEGTIADKRLKEEFA